MYAHELKERDQENGVQHTHTHTHHVCICAMRDGTKRLFKIKTIYTNMCNVRFAHTETFILIRFVNILILNIFTFKFI